jgi:hypothetical protein
MGDTFKTVFWSLFGLAEKEGVHLEEYHNRFTEMVGYFIYGAFNIASVIVLLNMLIAMMSKSYETIEEHADVEWKFARSKLYMEYIKEGTEKSTGLDSLDGGGFICIRNSRNVCSTSKLFFSIK